MSSRDFRPKWWQLNLTFPLLIGLFVLERRLQISPRGHQMAQIGIILLVYGLIFWWLKANSAALSKIDSREYQGSITVIGSPPSERENSDKDKRSMFEFPNSEIKGVLSNTFEVDYIDEQSLPTVQASQELEKD